MDDPDLHGVGDLFWIVIIVMIDILSRPDLSGWGKAGWIMLIIMLPLLGVLIAYSAGIAERRA